MSTDISKICADFLRARYNSIKASHARELVAAFWGYKSHAAQLSEQKYKLEKIDAAEYLIPAIARMDDRRQRLEELPQDLPGSKAIAKQLSEFLKEKGFFQGGIWLVDNIGDYVIEEYLLENFALDNELSGEIAGTNAIFDDIYYESAEVNEFTDNLTITAKGLYSGQTEDDKPFAGDEIDFIVTVELPRVAGKTAFLKPEITANGTLRDWHDSELDDQDKDSRTFSNQPPIVKTITSPVVLKKASPVDTQTVPKWLEGILTKAFPNTRWRKDYATQLQTLEDLFEGIEMDHWGTTEWCHVKHCFVTEPYGVDQTKVAKLKEKGRRLGFAVVYDSVSFHNPGGGCERVLIFPTDLSPRTKYEPSVITALEEAGCEIENGLIKSKDMEIVRDQKEDRSAFEQSMQALGISPGYFSHIPFAVHRTGSQFILRCLKVNVPGLKRLLNRGKRLAKLAWQPDPNIVIIQLNDNQLLTRKHGLYASNDGFFIGAFEQKSIRTKYADRVEKLFITKLKGQLLRSIRSEVNQLGEQHIFIELKQPISAKAFRELYRELKPELAKIPYSGSCGTNLTKTASNQSISDFRKETLRQ